MENYIGNKCIFIIFVSYFLLSFNCAKVIHRKASDETSLIRDLFANYDNVSRPRVNSSEVVEIEVECYLILLRDLYWIDDYLQWDPEDYDNLTEIIVPQSYVWLPDVAIENSAGGIYGEAYDPKIRIHILNTGELTYSPSGQVETTCNVNLKYFPFDIQKCDIIFANWMYTGKQVVLSNLADSMIMTRFEPNGQWEILNTTLSAGVDMYDSISYPYVTATLTLRRKPLFYLIYVALPCILLSVLSLLVFWIPPDAGERISLGITVLLSFSVFQLVLIDKMPDSSDYIPIIGIYLMLVMLTTALTLIFSIIVLNVYFTPATSAVPPWVRRLIMGWLAYILCTTGHHKQKQSLTGNNSVTNSFSAPGNETMKNNIGGSLDNKMTSQNQKRNIWGNGMLGKCHKSHQTLEEASGTESGKVSNHDSCNEWKLMAKILDRFFFALVATMDLVMAICCMVLVPMLNSTAQETK